MELFAKDLVPYRDWIIVKGRDAIVLSNRKFDDGSGVIRVMVLGAGNEDGTVTSYSYYGYTVVLLVATGVGHYATAS